MDKLTFRKNLSEATLRLVVFTKTRCTNEFSENYRYILKADSGSGDNHLTQFELSALERRKDFENSLLDYETVVELLHQENTVPIWINVSIREAHNDVTVIELFCSRRLRGESELMHPGFPPFHLLIAMPPESLKIETDGKFDVNWQIARS